jgi:5-methyltetrahydrofolate--homocysteine methyltransferase
MTRAERIAASKGPLSEPILVIDGAMGTMIQSHHPSEEDYRGTRFRDWPSDEPERAGASAAGRLAPAALAMA